MTQSAVACRCSATSVHLSPGSSAMPWSCAVGRFQRDRVSSEKGRPIPWHVRVVGPEAVPERLHDEHCAPERQQGERDRQRRLNPRTKDDFALLRSDLKLWREAVGALLTTDRRRADALHSEVMQIAYQ